MEVRDAGEKRFDCALRSDPGDSDPYHLLVLGLGLLAAVGLLLRKKKAVAALVCVGTTVLAFGIWLPDGTHGGLGRKTRKKLRTGTHLLGQRRLRNVVVPRVYVAQSFQNTRKTALAGHSNPKRIRLSGRHAPNKTIL